MAKSEKPGNSWETTYGFRSRDGKFVEGRFQERQRDIGSFFRDQGRHNDFRDFFGALGVMEGGPGRYGAHDRTGTYRGIYQINKEQLDYLDFFNTYGKTFNVKNMDDFQKSPMAQEAAGLLSFMGTPGRKDSRFKATAKAMRRNGGYLPELAEDGTVCDVTFVDKKRPGWEHTVPIRINHASVSAAAHLVGQGAMGAMLDSVVAGHKAGKPARIDINDPHAHDGNNVLFAAYMQLTEDYDLSGLVTAIPSQAFDAHLARLMEGRREEEFKRARNSSGHLAESAPHSEGRTSNPTSASGLTSRGNSDLRTGGKPSAPPEAGRIRNRNDPAVGKSPPVTPQTSGAKTRTTSGAPLTRPTSAGLQNLLDSFGRTFSSVVGPARNWLYPEPASNRRVLHPSATAILPKNPLTSPSRGQTAPESEIPVSITVPSRANAFGPSPFPAYTGAPPDENGRIPIGIGIGPYPQYTPPHIRFDLPGTLGGGEWLKNRLSPETLQGVVPGAIRPYDEPMWGLPGPVGPWTPSDHNLRKRNYLSGPDGAPWPWLP
jgi:hypothetical protein